MFFMVDRAEHHHVYHSLRIIVLFGVHECPLGMEIATATCARMHSSQTELNETIAANGLNVGKKRSPRSIEVYQIPGREKPVLWTALCYEQHWLKIISPCLTLRSRLARIEFF
jgi:hypothetical protein